MSKPTVQRQVKMILKSMARLNEVLHGRLDKAMWEVNEVLDQLEDLPENKISSGTVP